MIVVFDTNVYRNIVSQKSESESVQLIKSIRDKELEKGIIPMMSSTVAMELIKHLHDDKNSRPFKSCALASKIMYKHTGDSENFRMLPLPENQIAMAFFGIYNKKATDTQHNLGRLLYLLSTNFDEALEKYSAQIKQVKQFIENGEKTYIECMNALCKQIDPSFLNWPPFQNNDKKRKEFLDFVRSKSFYEQTAKALLCAVEQDLIAQGERINISDSKRFEQISNFIKNYEIPLNFRSWVWSQFVNGDFDPQKKSRANYLWDEYILHFANQTASGKPILLVTSDTKMIDAAKRVNSNCLIKNYDEYLKFLGI